MIQIVEITENQSQKSIKWSNGVCLLLMEMLIKMSSVVISAVLPPGSLLKDVGLYYRPFDQKGALLGLYFVLKVCIFQVG